MDPNRKPLKPVRNAVDLDLTRANDTEDSTDKLNRLCRNQDEHGGKLRREGEAARKGRGEKTAGGGGSTVKRGGARISLNESE